VSFSARSAARIPKLTPVIVGRDVAAAIIDEQRQLLRIE
jgi:hypothetical protein